MSISDNWLVDQDALARSLPVLKRELPGILTRFYEWVQGEGGMGDYIARSSRSTDQLADLQFRHWIALFENGADDDFHERARRIGEVHFRIGLKPDFYISGYAFIQREIANVIGAYHKFRGRRCGEMIGAVTTLLMFDMQAALSTYSHSVSVGENLQTSTRFANDLMDSSIQVSMAVNEASIQNARMDVAIHKVNSQAQSISAAVEETVTGIQQIAQTTNEVSEIAQEADRRAREGSSVVRDAVNQIDTITNVVSSTAQLVNNLSESSRQIGEIVNSIEEIASQTNLLALNATIEAARAGEAGKGFAVVASEVKLLSNQTSDATDEIRSRINGLVSEMEQIVASMSEANEMVGNGQAAMHQVTETMEGLRGDVSTVAGRMEDVSQILREQSAASNEVADGVTHIAEMSKQNVEALNNVIDDMKTVEREVIGQINSFLTYDMPHKVLRLAKSDHVVWKKRLADMLAGRDTLYPDELADHTACRLGKFYYGDSAAHYRHLPSFKALEKPHAAVHSAGIEAARLYNEGKYDQAFEAVQKVEAASVEVLRLLDKAREEADAEDNRDRLNQSPGHSELRLAS